MTLLHRLEIEGFSFYKRATEKIFFFFEFVNARIGGRRESFSISYSLVEIITVLHMNRSLPQVSPKNFLQFFS